MPLYKPNGSMAEGLNRLILLEMWAAHLYETEDKSIIFAAIIMDPMFVVGEAMALAQIAYWEKYEEIIQYTKVLLKDSRTDLEHASEYRDEIVDAEAAISYGNPRGQLSVRCKISQILNDEYKLADKADEENIFLLMNGQTALQGLIRLVHNRDPDAVIVTPTPYNYFYQVLKDSGKLYPIKLLDAPGYKLTADALEKSLIELKIKKITVGAFVFCDPNVLGNTVDANEWGKIADVLRAYLRLERELPSAEKTPIVLDEGFLFPRKASLLSIAPDLSEHFILLRFSAPIRCSSLDTISFAFSKNISYLGNFLSFCTNIYGHPPISLQESLAAGYEAINPESFELLNIFYPPQVSLVHERATSTNIVMPDKNYKTDGAGYIFLNLIDLIGQPMTEKANLVFGEPRTMKTDEDICYHLLFSEGIMVCPASYLGAPAQNAFICIACSLGDTQMNVLMDKIDNQVLLARNNKIKSKEIAAIFSQHLPQQMQTSMITPTYSSASTGVDWQTLAKSLGELHAHLAVKKTFN